MTFKYDNPYSSHSDIHQGIDTNVRQKSRDLMQITQNYLKLYPLDTKKLRTELIQIELNFKLNSNPV